jgi:diguanylate cyclase (GGDEF)-like protein/PAS domain S-box-containing protein
VLGWNPSDLDGKSFWELTISDEHTDIPGVASTVSNGHPVIFAESQVKSRDGRLRQLRWSAYPDLESETIIAILRTTLSTDEDQEIFRLAIEASPTVIFIVEQGEILYANQLSELVFGYTQSELIGSSIEMLVPGHLKAIHENHRKAYDQKPYLRLMGSSLELSGQRKDGLEFPVDIGLNPVSTQEGLVIVCSVIDLTKRKAAEKHIAEKIRQLENEISVLDKLVLTDELTAINNRRALFKQLELNFRIAQNENHPISFILLDIDNFKHYNDSYGHMKGDQVLQTIANIMKNSIRKTEIVARYGGEEFATILPATNAADATALAERLRKTIEESNWANQNVTISAGTATLHPKANDNIDLQEINKLIIMADKALYASKNSGKNKVTHFHDLELAPGEDLFAWKIKHETPTDR